MAGITIGRTAAEVRIANGFTIALLEYGAGQRVAAHEHDFSYFGLVLSGGFQDHAGNSSDWCTPGTVLVRPASAAHRTEYGDADAKILSVELAIADGELIRDPFVSRDPALVRILTELHAETQMRDRWSDLAIEGLSLQFLAGMGRARSETSAPRWVGLVEERLREGSTEPSLAQLASIANLRPRRFTVEFRRWFRCTPAAYMRRLRLEQARYLVERGHLPIAVIAARLGYSDASHLTRDFRRRYGVPPSLYRG